MEKNQAQLSFKKLFYARKSFSRLILRDYSQLPPSAASFEKTKYNSSDIILDLFEYQNGNFSSKDLPTSSLFGISGKKNLCYPY
jgi:hypothetical protein